MARIFLSLLVMGCLASAEPAVVPVDVQVEITGYRLEGSTMLAVIQVTNREPVPIYHYAHADDQAIVRLSWEVDEAWVDEQIWFCGVGMQKRFLAAGAQREFTWRVGELTPGRDREAAAWRWIPANWPIRAGIRFHRDGSEDWWEAVSVPYGIDEDLRPVMLHAVAARAAPHPVIATAVAATSSDLGNRAGSSGLGPAAGSQRAGRTPDSAVVLGCSVADPGRDRSGSGSAAERQPRGSSSRLQIERSAP